MFIYCYCLFYILNYFLFLAYHSMQHNLSIPSSMYLFCILRILLYFQIIIFIFVLEIEDIVSEQTGHQIELNDSTATSKINLTI